MTRLLLILIIVFLITRIFVLYGSIGNSEKKSPDTGNKNTDSKKGVPKGIGEYVDYEEVDKK
jgi:preprotein translocase subunit SecG